LEITTPSQSGPVNKPVFVGGGVVVEVPGTRFHVTAEVLEINEEAEIIKVKGEGFEGWILKGQIHDSMSPSTYAVDHALNVIGGGDGQ
jgi:hypothetical protein